MPGMYEIYDNHAVEYDELVAREDYQGNLKNHLSRITFSELDNFNSSGLAGKADVVLEGWSFGHTVSDDPDRWEDISALLVENCRRLVRPGGKVIFIESLGTMVTKPNPPGESLGKFYAVLEKEYGFSRTVVSTDYRFESIEEAKRIMGFFFGGWIVPEIEKLGSPVIPEYTGIWTLSVT